VRNGIFKSGDSHDLAQAVTISTIKSRPQSWGEEAPEDAPVRRVLPSVPLNGRALPGMPLETGAREADDLPRFGSDTAWWRPASKTGRVFLGLGVLLVLGGLGAAGYFLKTSLSRDARFRIEGLENIQATGLTEVSRAEMLPVFGADIGKNIFFVHLDERRKQLEEIPWVERATVMRVLPDQIRVTVVERQPVAFTRQGQQIGLVDANGVLLTMPPAMMAQHHYSFPVVTGIDPRDPPLARKGRMALYARLLAELDGNNQHFSEQISEIDLTDPEDARVTMPEQGADILAHFGEDQFLERYQRYKDHIAEWRQQYPKLAAVDLRYAQQVVLEMAPGAGTAQTTVGDSASNLNQVNLPQSTSQANGAAKPNAGPQTKAEIGNPANVPSQKNSKTAAQDRLSVAARAKAARDKKKRTGAKRAALNLSKRKPASTTHPAVAAAQGE